MRGARVDREKPEVIDVAANLRLVRERIEAACTRARRDPEEVTLVCVTKTHPAEMVRLAIQAGVTDLGENYVQEAAGKIETLGRDVRWHMIGSLQSNKANRAAELFDVVQSVDSTKLATRLSSAVAGLGRTLDVLVEVNVGAEETKGGVDTASALDLAGEVAGLPGLRLLGLMGMPPFEATGDELRGYFRQLRQIFEQLPEENRQVLSMGMSGDFEMAIEEGSTMVRVGSAIFGARGA